MQFDINYTIIPQHKINSLLSLSVIWQEKCNSTPDSFHPIVCFKKWQHIFQWILARIAKQVVTILKVSFLFFKSTINLKSVCVWGGGGSAQGKIGIFIMLPSRNYFPLYSTTVQPFLSCKLGYKVSISGCYVLGISLRSHIMIKVMISGWIAGNPALSTVYEKNPILH